MSHALDVRDAEREARRLGVLVEIKRRTGEAKFWFPDEVGGPAVTNVRKKCANRTVHLRLRRLRALRAAETAETGEEVAERKIGASVARTPATTNERAKTPENGATTMTEKTTTTEATTDAKPAGKKRRRMLNHGEVCRLYELLSAERERIEAEKMTPKRVATFATGSLGFEVSPANVRSVMGPGEAAAIAYEWPETRRAAPKKTSVRDLESRVSELETMVLRILEKLDAAN